ncbi:MAG: PCMD domain-containing protein [Bacteroidales bacterium]
MKKPILYFILLLFVGINSCQKNDKETAPSNNANIISAEITENKEGIDILKEGVIDLPASSVLFRSNEEIKYPVTLGIDVVISPNAKVISPLTEYTFKDENGVKITIQSESGIKKDWTFRIAKGDLQIENSQFKIWRTVTNPNGKTYPEIGKDDNSAWATANKGITILEDANVVPYKENNVIMGAMITTEEVPVYTVGAGALFTGVFDFDQFDPNNPESATIFGTPFFFKPKAMRITFKYTPGKKNTDRNGKELGYADHCDIYAIIENRKGEVKTQLAKAQYNTTETIDDFVTKDLEFNYTNNSLNSTHISIVMTSSAEGNDFKGAIGSQLIVRNIEMIYE